MIWAIHDWANRNSAEHAALRVLETHLRNFPNEWSADNFYLRCGSGVALWVASGRGFLRIHASSSDRQKGLGILWRRRLWRYVGPLVRRRKISTRFRESVDWAERLIDNLEPTNNRDRCSREPHIAG